MTARCAACHEERDLAELLAVKEMATGRLWHVCRPMLATSCFRRAVGRASQHRISVPAIDPATAVAVVGSAGGAGPPGSAPPQPPTRSTATQERSQP